MIEHRAEKQAAREDEIKIRCSGSAQIEIGAYYTSTSFHIRTSMTSWPSSRLEAPRGSENICLHSPRRTVSGTHVMAVSICDGRRTASGLR